MSRIRGKLTYSNVMVTVLAILVIGGGTAYAASEMLPKGSVGTQQIKKEAVTPGKLSKTAKATLTGPTGPTGAKGATGSQGPKGDRGETGAAGSAVAYARVEANGTLDAVHSKNILSLTPSGTSGVYCVTPSVPVTSAVASTPHVGGDEGVLAQANIIANGDPPSGSCSTPVWVSTWGIKSGLVAHSFYVVFN